MSPSRRVLLHPLVYGIISQTWIITIIKIIPPWERKVMNHKVDLLSISTYGRQELSGILLRSVHKHKSREVDSDAMRVSIVLPHCAPQRQPKRVMWYHSLKNQTKRGECDEWDTRGCGDYRAGTTFWSLNHPRMEFRKRTTSRSDLVTRSMFANFLSGSFLGKSLTPRPSSRTCLMDASLYPRVIF